MRKFRITFETTAVQLSTIVSLLANECQNFNVTEVESGHHTSGPKTQRRRKQHRQSNILDTVAGRAVYDSMKATPKRAFKLADFASVMTNLGFQPKSASSSLYGLKKAGLVTHDPSTHIYTINLENSTNV
jgi:hypothetical protein